ncbi:hypothetical protein ERC79_15130 [Rhodococcus sp. ABRD24]|uniref:hypothetical protein n=1 Tax=Rhodococcus sp. ABRD24 TaxID=2507582 RepID=UPI00103B2C28|nr:hypothetical protein [Rhodococcus sp. ABRD24]QBJ97133.1 hypothetical protein ERC79_15130 [Rhodococcus sp. ABRD24]
MGPSRIFVGMIAIAALAGCGTQDEDTTAAAPPPTTSTEVPGLVEPTCLAGNLLGFSGLPQTAPPAPEPMPIPAGFAPVRVVTCENDSGPGTGADTAAWIEEQREGDLTAVLEGYALPSDPPQTTRINGVDERTCFVDQPNPPIVWLVDDRGLGMRPTLPVDDCGGFKWDAITAIRALPLVERIVHQVPMSPGR